MQNLLFWLRDHLIAEDSANKSSNFLYCFPQKPLKHRHFTSAVHQFWWLQVLAKLIAGAKLRNEVFCWSEKTTPRLSLATKTLMALWHATRRSGIMENTNGWLIKDDKSRLKQQVQLSFLHDDLTYIMMYYGMSAETAESENAEQFVGLFLWPLRKEKCKTGPFCIPKTSAFCRYRNECQTSWVRNELEHNVRQPSARTNVLSIRSFGFIGMYW